MPTANITNNIQLSAISNLDKFNLPIPLGGVNSDLSFVDIANNLSIEVSYTTNNNKIVSKKLALTDLFSAISSYVSYERSLTSSIYLKVENETRTWRPSSDITILPTSNKPFLVRNHDNNSPLIRINNASINIETTRSKIKIDNNEITFKSARLSSYATTKNVVRADQTLILNATGTEFAVDGSAQPCVRIHAGNATTNGAPIEFEGNKQVGSNDTIAHFDVKIGNGSVRNNQGEVGCIALSAKWA